MEFKYDTPGQRRKELVTAIANILNSEASYQGPPTFGYMISGCTVDRNGTLLVDSSLDPETVMQLIDGLTARGFKAENLPGAEAKAYTEDHAEAPAENGIELDQLVIEMPRAGFSETAIINLERLLASKSSLIKNALGVDSLAIVVTEETIRFPWFSGSLSPEEINAYARFIRTLCAMAKNQKRVTATEKPADNEKYAFRCFLLRLGFIGKEYQTERKILMSRLSGNSAWKTVPAASEEVTGA